MAVPDVVLSPLTPLNKPHGGSRSAYVVLAFCSCHHFLPARSGTRAPMGTLMLPPARFSPCRKACENLCIPRDDQSRCTHLLSDWSNFERFSALHIDFAWRIQAAAYLLPLRSQVSGAAKIRLVSGGAAGPSSYRRTLGLPVRPVLTCGTFSVVLPYTCCRSILRLDCVVRVML